MQVPGGFARLVAVFGACALTTAQEPRLLYANISSSDGFYTDAIVLLEPSGGTSVAAQRPLVQEGTDRRATIFPRRVQYRRQGDVDYVYWVNTFGAASAFTGLLRGADRNGNGTVDESEIEPLFAFGPSAAAGFDEAGGVWWVGNAARSGPQFGLWRLQDGDGDGDFFDAGEATHVIATATVVTADPAPGPYTTSSDDLHAVGMMANGDCLWTDDDTHVLWRTTPAGVTRLFLVHKAPRNTTPVPPPLNVDFASGALPAVFGNLEHIAVDRAHDTVYLGVEFRDLDAYVFVAQDRNGDGDAQDAGEVRVFFDGVAAGFGPLNDLVWHAGSIWGSYEVNGNGPSQFWRLTDNNGDGDADDAGEAVFLGRTAPTDDPRILGMAVVPAGTFDAAPPGAAEGCVLADLRNTPVTTAGGVVTWTFANLPQALHNDATVGVLWHSLSGDTGLPLPLPPFCYLALTPDAFFAQTSGLHSSGVITGATAPAGTLRLPAGLPLGLRLWSWGLFFRTSDATIRGTTDTNLVEVRS